MKDSSTEQSSIEKGIEEGARLFKTDSEQVRRNITTITRALRVVEKSIDVALRDQKQKIREWLEDHFFGEPQLKFFDKEFDEMQ